MNWALHVERLAKGETVSFRPKGNSMVPKIQSGQLVTVSPDVSALKEGDIVFCKVKGTHYVHLVKGIKTEGDKKLFLIGNNRGGLNGWIGANALYGRVTSVTD